MGGGVEQEWWKHARGIGASSTSSYYYAVDPSYYGAVPLTEEAARSGNRHRRRRARRLKRDLAHLVLRLVRLRLRLGLRLYVSSVRIGVKVLNLGWVWAEA